VLGSSIGHFAGLACDHGNISLPELSFTIALHRIFPKARTLQWFNT
jgi:hypothetical protein